MAVHDNSVMMNLIRGRGLHGMNTKCRLLTADRDSGLSSGSSPLAGGMPSKQLCHGVAPPTVLLWKFGAGGLSTAQQLNTAGWNTTRVSSYASCGARDFDPPSWWQNSSTAYQCVNLGC